MYTTGQIIATGVFGFITGIGLMSWIFILLECQGRLTFHKKQIKGEMK